MGGDPSPDRAGTDRAERPGRPCRSYLFVPGSNPRRLEKALELEADAVLVDLEDAVPPAEKARARSILSEWLGSGAAASGRRIFVRVNLEGGRVPEEDLDVACQQGVEGIFVPKVETAGVIEAVDRALTGLERERGLSTLSLVALVETAKGVLDLREFAGSSPRLRAVALGTVDLMADLGVEGSDLLLDWARAQVILTSRAAGLDPPIDTVFVDISDPTGLARETRRAKQDGFFGKLLIHPSQIGPANAIFTPSQEEVAAARRLLAAYESSLTAGEGALIVDGRLVDRASVRTARSLIALVEGPEG